jgi:hypothetical protein
MDNVEFNKSAKFQLEIPYNRGCAKITKFDIYSSEKLSKAKNLLDFIIFIELKCKVFGVEILQTRKIRH